MRLIHKISFHGFSNRVCMLQFSMAERDFQVFACYFPTAWDSVTDVEKLYQLVTMFVDSGQATNATILLGGDFNAHVGSQRAGDDLNHVGQYGMGSRNDRGSMLIRWIMSHNFQLMNRMRGGHNNWTCERFCDGMRVQVDFLIGSLHVDVLDFLNDFAIPIGVHHRCVHCRISIAVAQRATRRPPRVNFKGWAPYVDEFGRAAIFQDELSAWASNNTHTQHSIP